MSRILFILFLLGATTRAASAQIARPEAASFGLGFEHGAVIELGYRRPVIRIDEAASAHARLQMPSVPGLGEGALEIGGELGRVTPAGWGATGKVSASVRWVDGHLLGLGQGGLVLGGAAGYFHRRGLATAELAWEHSLVTYARPTDAYRRMVYADARSSFHGAGGGTLRAGIAASVAATSRLDVAIRAGYTVTEELGAVPGLPFYAVASGAVRF